MSWLTETVAIRILALIAEKGDFSHLILFFLASVLLGLLIWTMKQLNAANARFERFVLELEKLNQLLEEP